MKLDVFANTIFPYRTGTSPIPKLVLHHTARKTQANAQEYDRVLAKAELSGPSSLNSQEKELFKRMLNEVGSRGNQARRIING